MEGADKLLENIDKCFLPKLATNYDTSDIHTEYETRNSNLMANVKVVLQGLDKIDLKRSLVDDTAETVKGDRISVISSVLKLYLELLCDCSWNTVNAKEYAKKINKSFQNNCEIKLEDVLRKNEVIESQLVFDRIVDDLCFKLTSEDFKKYPGLVEVYCDIVQNLKDFDVEINALKILPVALIFTDDYIEANKIKGLRCCQILLKNLTSKDFEHGNFYDVIYISVKNALHHRDLKITEMSEGCMLELCQFFPSDIMDEKLDEMYTDALEQLNTEANLYRKASLFKYVKKVMQLLQIKCVGKTLFKTVICDNIDNCLTDTVAEILLMPTLECLEEWIKYCWPVWKLPVDYKVLCCLLKYYSKSSSSEGGLFAQKLIVTLISLCSAEEQKQFVIKLGGKGDDVRHRMEALRKDVGV